MHDDIWFNMTPEERAEFIRDEEQSKRPDRLAPKLHACALRLQKPGESLWPPFDEPDRVEALIVEWYRTGPDLFVDWTKLFDAINKLCKFRKDNEDVWNDQGPGLDFFDWDLFLKHCERTADPDKWEAKIAREAERAEKFKREKEERDLEERKLAEAEKRRKLSAKKFAAKRAEQKRIKKSRTANVKRIRKALKCGRTRAYDICDNGTEDPVQQHKLAKEFADMPERSTATAWATKGTTRYARSLKTFLLSGIWEFDDDLAPALPDLKRLRDGATSAPLSDIRKPELLGLILGGLGGNPANAYPIFVAFLQWRDTLKRPVVPDARTNAK